MKANDAASSEPTDPARLMPLPAEKLSDLVETFNVFIVGDPKGRARDQVRLGPQETDTSKSVVDAAAPIVRAAIVTGFLTTSAKEVLTEQMEGATNAPPSVDGDQAIDQTRKTESNFIAELLRLAYIPARWALGAGRSEAGFAWKEVRAGAYRFGGGAIVLGGYTYQREIIEFVANNATALKHFVAQAFDNPTLIKIIDAIAHLPL
jgi:hypothetical protein